jgi:hypothetical protein
MGDFARLEERWQSVYTLAAATKAACHALDLLKTELILDDEKKAAMTPVGNQYPDYNMNSICADVDRMIALSAILAENGY